jgi:hypothetical protein
MSTTNHALKIRSGALPLLLKADGGVRGGGLDVLSEEWKESDSPPFVELAFTFRLPFMAM